MRRAKRGLIGDDDGRTRGVAKVEGKTPGSRPRAIILASGGFETNAEIPTRYLGPGWDLAKVRGTRFNTGAGIKMALDIGAMPYGNWSGCHEVGCGYNAPEFGDLAVGDNFQKHSYPFAIGISITRAGPAWFPARCSARSPELPPELQCCGAERDGLLN